MRITCEIYFVNSRERRANRTADRKGIFQKFQWKQKDFLSKKRTSVWFFFCFGEGILQAWQNTLIHQCILKCAYTYLLITLFVFEVLCVCEMTDICITQHRFLPACLRHCDATKWTNDAVLNTHIHTHTHTHTHTYNECMSSWHSFYFPKAAQHI